MYRSRNKICNGNFTALAKPRSPCTPFPNFHCRSPRRRLPASLPFNNPSPPLVIWWSCFAFSSKTPRLRAHYGVWLNDSSRSVMNWSTSPMPKNERRLAGQQALKSTLPFLSKSCPAICGVFYIADSTMVMIGGPGRDRTDDLPLTKTLCALSRMSFPKANREAQAVCRPARVLVNEIRRCTPVQGSAVQRQDLMAPCQVLEFEGSARAEDRRQGGEECRERNEHRK